MGIIKKIFKLIFGKEPTKIQYNFILVVLVGAIILFTRANFSKILEYINIESLWQGDFVVREDKIGELISDSVNSKINGNEVGGQERPSLDNPGDYVGVYKVLKVIDGDTIELENGQAVRYIGIDTPEIGECYYEQATERNRELVAGMEVVLEADKEDKDIYGRLLRYVYIDDEMINDVLVREGFAREREYQPNDHYQTVLEKSGGQAAQNNIGLWQDCENN